MTTFLALYRGTTIGDSVLIAVSADQKLVSSIAEELASQIDDQEPGEDDVDKATRHGQKKVLQLIAGQSKGKSLRRSR